MSHNHQHEVNHANIGKAFRWGITLNIIYVIVEFAYGFFSNSLSLLADAGHNLSDVGSLALSLLAFNLAQKKATKRHTYGYRKATVLSSLANAVILLLVVGGIGYEAVNRLLHTENSDGKTVAWVAGIGIVVNAVSAWLFFRDKKHDLNVKGAYLHLLSDALVSVGVVITGLAIAFTAWPWLDPLISLVIMIVILMGTWGLLKESLALSLDAVPETIDTDKIIAVISSCDDVCAVNHVHIWAISTTQNALTAYITVKPNTPIEKIRQIRDGLKHMLEHEDINHATLEIDYMGTEDERASHCETVRTD